MLGVYIHRDSPVHSVPPTWKVMALAASATAAFHITNLLVLGAALAFCLLLFRLARLPACTAIEQLRPLVPVLLLFFVVQVGFVGWESGGVMVARVAVLVLLAALVSLTTRASDMIEALERLLSVLRPLGVNAGKLSLMMALAIRLIPLLMGLVREIRMAQRARGAECSALALLVPLTIKMLRMADHLSDALEARGYDPQ